jgi:microcystin-dependent protein
MASTPFLGEVKIVSFNFAPQGWALCNGSLLPINQNQALFSLLGTMYGGNGQTNFALPDLRGRIPMHWSGSGGSFPGERGGETAHTVTMGELPVHAHVMNGTQSAATSVSGNNALLANATVNIYADPASLAAIAPESVSPKGGSQPHNNMSPYTTLNFVIALSGFFPSHS